MEFNSLVERSRRAERVAEALGALAPSEVSVVAGAVRDFADELYPEERLGIINAVQKRRDEFSSGRAYARQALAAIGASSSPILVDSDRSPIWPCGYTASISHSHGTCAVVAARRTGVASLGLDVEWIADVSKDVLANISTPEEIRMNAEAVQPRALPACLFSIREAVFKAYYPVTKAFLDFSDVVVKLDGAGGEFLARLTAPSHRTFFGRSTLSGRFALAGGYVVALVVELS